MKSLKEQLFEKTLNLKTEYINATIKWTNSHYEYLKKMSYWKTAEWCEYLAITPEKHNEGTSSEFFSYPKGFYNTHYAKELHAKMKEIRSIMNLGIEKYLEKQIKSATLHYDQSINKLIFRLRKKGMDETKSFTISEEKINQNFECIISFHTKENEMKIVKAWTIIASGIVQKPHYRYLMK